MKTKRNLLFFLPIILICVAILIHIAVNNKNLEVNIKVSNNTNKNLNLDLSVFLGIEDTSSNNKIISLSAVKSGSMIEEKTTINTPEGDFGIVLNIDGTTDALYFSRGSMLTKISYTLEIIDSSEGNIILKGDVTYKGFLGIKSTKEIKPIIIQGE
jgi:hypothetical protein